EHHRSGKAWSGLADDADSSCLVKRVPGQDALAYWVLNGVSRRRFSFRRDAIDTFLERRLWSYGRPSGVPPDAQAEHISAPPTRARCQAKSGECLQSTWKLATILLRNGLRWRRNAPSA